MIEEVEFSQQYIYTQARLFVRETLLSCASCSGEKLKEKFMVLAADKEENFRYSGAGNFYGKIRNGEFEIDREGEILKLEIDDLFVESASGYNKIRREFSLSVEINETEKAQ